MRGVILDLKIINCLLHSIPSVVVEIMSLKTERLLENNMIRSFLGIHWIPLINSYGFPHETGVRILEIMFQTTFKYM